MEGKLRKCPFCGRPAINDETCSFMDKLDDGGFVLTHHCNPYLSPLTVAISVYGCSPQECIDNWNGGAHENETSESL